MTGSDLQSTDPSRRSCGGLAAGHAQPAPGGRGRRRARHEAVRGGHPDRRCDPSFGVGGSRPSGARRARRPRRPPGGSPRPPGRPAHGGRPSRPRRSRCTGGAAGAVGLPARPLQRPDAGAPRGPPVVPQGPAGLRRPRPHVADGARPDHPDERERSSTHRRRCDRGGRLGRLPLPRAPAVTTSRTSRASGSHASSPGRTVATSGTRWTLDGSAIALRLPMAPLRSAGEIRDQAGSRTSDHRGQLRSGRGASGGWSARSRARCGR